MIDTSKFVNKDMKDKLNLTIKALAGGNHPHRLKDRRPYSLGKVGAPILNYLFKNGHQHQNGRDATILDSERNSVKILTSLSLDQVICAVKLLSTI